MNNEQKKNAAPSAPIGATVDTLQFRILLADTLCAAERAEEYNDPDLYQPARNRFVAHIDQYVASQVRAARAAALDEAIAVCEAIHGDRRDAYKGRGAHAPNNPKRADPHCDGEGDGALACAEAVEAIKGPPAISHSGEGAAAGDILQSAPTSAPVEPAPQSGKAAAANAGGRGTPTDLSHRLRETADQQPGWKPLLTAAADEIERYYGGMLAWKQTAEKKDRDWNTERMGRVNDRCEARAAATSAGEVDARQVEFAAKAIYELLPPCQGVSAKEYPWQPGGNSMKQQEARDYARAALKADRAAAVGASDVVLRNDGQEPDWETHSKAEDEAADAARYRWLRCRDNLEAQNLIDRNWDERLDAAIDAAMNRAATQGPHAQATASESLRSPQEAAGTEKGAAS